MPQQQNLPGSTTRPDYSGLREMSVQPNDASAKKIEEALDTALPEDPANPTLKALKDLIRKFMSRTDELGRLLVKPSTYEVMTGVRHAFESNPSFVNVQLVRSLTRTATHDAEFSTDSDGHLYADGGRVFPSGRRSAVQALDAAIEARPDLADAELVRNVAQIAGSEPDSSVRAEAQRVLAGIVAKRPDLIDSSVLSVIQKTAASSGPYSVQKNQYNEKLIGWQDDALDSQARDVARQTVKAIKDKRPDLFAGPGRVVPAASAGTAQLHGTRAQIPAS